MLIKEFDTVILKDGKIATIMEAFDDKAFIVDVAPLPSGNPVPQKLHNLSGKNPPPKKST